MKPTVIISMNTEINPDEHTKYQLKHVDRENCDIDMFVKIGDTITRLSPEKAYMQLFNAVLNGVE